MDTKQFELFFNDEEVDVMNEVLANMYCVFSNTKVLKSINGNICILDQLRDKILQYHKNWDFHNKWNIFDDDLIIKLTNTDINLIIMSIDEQCKVVEESVIPTYTGVDAQYLAELKQKLKYYKKYIEKA